MRNIQMDITVIKETVAENRSKVLAGIAALLVVAVTAFFIAQPDGSDPAEEAASAEHREAGEEAGHDREGFVEITPARLEASGIRTTTVEEGSLASEIIAQATVTAPPEGQALLTARADGAVVRINKRLGDPVGAGETVALLESREAAAFVAERSAAAARAQAARAAADREQRLFDANVTARQDLEAAQAARAQAEAELGRAQAAVRAAGVTDNGRYLAVRSPISGRITEVDTQLGAYVSAGEELFNVANPNRIQIDAFVPSADAQRVRPGDEAMIELPDGGVIDAVVRSTTPSLNTESRAATVVLTPQGTHAGLTQGQAVRVRITPRGAPTSDRIVLPEEAVQSFEGRDVVFVRVEGGFQAVPVTLGQRSAGRVEITSGLKPGQTIATTSAFLLKAELGKGAGEEH
jgi:membrane fusion protein, heavy metal efflux system